MYKILIVDDEKMIREGIKNGIPWKKLNIDTVLTAASGAEAVRLSKMHIDILLTDISMEGMSGLELVTDIRKNCPDIRIVMMTAYDRFEYAQESLKLNVNDFLLKPISEEELAQALQCQIDILDDLAKKKKIQPIENVMEHTVLEWKFQQLIKNKLTPAELEMLLSDNGYPTKKPYEVVFLHMILNENDDEWANDRNFLWMLLRQVVMEIVDNEGCGITFQCKQDLTKVLIYCEEKVDEPMQVLKSIQNVIYSEYNVRVRIICGSVVTGIRSFMSSYDEAMKYLKESIGSYKMMMKPEINMLRDELFQSIFLELKNEILANVGNYPRIMHVFDVFVQDTVSYKLSVSQVREHCFELASALYYAYIAASGEMADNRLSQLITALSMTNAAEACKATSKFITEILVHEEEINHEIIHKAKAYINQHLADDISVTVLAEQNFMSVSYFSRLFKKVVGIGCNEYIVQKRIKAAENLLLTTPLPTGEIALRVGYKNKNYFSLAFKRKTGMAPTELRETSHYSHECQASDDDL